MSPMIDAFLRFVIALIFTTCSFAQDDIYGEPLFLTPYIQSGQIAEGQAAAKVEGLSSTIESFSGLITINAEYNSNIFFWFFPARYNSASAPVVIWLQGGPGSSSMFGLFVEHGPFVVDSHYRLGVREVNWAKEFNVIYIDQPVGAASLYGYPHNETEVGADVYEFLLQWFQLFNQFQDNEFYITGESYGGKFVPATAYTIYQNNDLADQKINLKGFAIGDGLIDPIHQMDKGDYLFWNGIIGEKELAYFKAIDDTAVVLIAEGKYIEALKVLGILGETNQKSNDETIPASFQTVFDAYFFQTTGLLFEYNYLYTVGPSDFNYYEEYLEYPHVRKAAHVGNLTFNANSNKAYLSLVEDLLQSVSPWLSELLNSGLYKIMLYNGQVDIVCSHSQATNLINYLDWYGAEDFANAERKVWRVDTVQVGGYARTAHNFTQVIVRNSGHYAPYDQPEWCYDMLTRFINDKGF